jgi:hypothetical protein
MKKRRKISEKVNDFKKEISQIVKDLTYLSETDAEILPFIGTKALEINNDTILSQTNKPLNSEIVEQKFDEFFEPLIELQSWFGAEEKQIAAQFAELKKILQENLIDIKVFRIGKIEIDIYVVGLDAENICRGIQTKAVET